MSAFGAFVVQSVHLCSIQVKRLDIFSSFRRVAALLQLPPPLPPLLPLLPLWSPLISLFGYCHQTGKLTVAI